MRQDIGDKKQLGEEIVEKGSVQRVSLIRHDGGGTKRHNGDGNVIRHDGGGTVIRHDGGGSVNDDDGTPKV